MINKYEIKFNNNDYLKIFFYNTTINPIKGEENSIEYHDVSFEINERVCKHYVTIQLKKTNRKFNIEKLNKLFKNLILLFVFSDCFNVSRETSEISDFSKTPLLSSF